MVRGPLPKMAVLGPSRIAQPELVKLQVGHIAHPVEVPSDKVAKGTSTILPTSTT
jgi:hypothetical protein